MKILFLVILSLTFSLNTYSSPLLEPKQSFHFYYPQGFPILDTGIFRIENENYLFNAFFVTKENAVSGMSYPLLIHKLNPEATDPKLTMMFKNVEHIRHHVVLNTPWGPGVLFADHGVDHNDLNKGGNLKLLVKNKTDSTLIDVSEKLKQGRNFVFNVVALKRKGQKYNDILLVTYNTGISHPVYLQASDNGYVDKSDMIPADWLNQKRCFMTGIAIDINKDGTDEALLGGCDQDLQYNPGLYDRILKLDKRSWVLQDEKLLPLRTGVKGWGTVYLLKEDLNRDGHDDIVALTHDYGFHVGFVQVMYFVPGKNAFTNIEVRNWPAEILKPSHHYLHKAVAYDIDNDGKKDIIGQINYINGNIVIKPNIFVLLNKGSYFEYQKSSMLHIKDENYVASVDVVRFGHNKKDSLVFTAYNGNVNIYNP